jgi:2-iminobutanoate/2-iminopropanoate deaminase
MSVVARQEIQVTGAPASRPYADAVRFGDMLFVSGLVGTDDTGALVAADAAGQTRQIMSNLGRILAEVGAGFNDVLKVTIYVIDMADRPAIGAIRSEFFGSTKPASTLVEVSRLVDPAMKVEIEAVVGIKAA